MIGIDLMAVAWPARILELAARMMRCPAVWHGPGEPEGIVRFCPRRYEPQLAAADRARCSNLRSSSARRRLWSVRRPGEDPAGSTGTTRKVLSATHRLDAGHRGDDRPVIAARALGDLPGACA